MLLATLTVDTVSHCIVYIANRPRVFFLAFKVRKRLRGIKTHLRYTPLTQRPRATLRTSPT